jgi:hypothetical protein
VTYDGNVQAPANAGTYAVIATINDANYEGNASDTLTIGKATTLVVLGDLSQTFDGSTKSASATTTPEGLVVNFTYDGNAEAPSNAGTYAVVATINDANYEGSTSDTLTIAKASASVLLGDLAQAYDGSAKSASAATTPESLAVDLTYDGSSTAPSNAGTYAVVATINDANYAGSASGDLVIGKAAAQVVLGDLSQTYNGSAKVASAATTPEGLVVDLTYNGLSTAPTGAGTYAVVATINDPNYEGSANGDLVIGKALASVALGDLAQTYDGNARSATVTTTPEGLAVDVSYDGSPQAPTDAGTYAVVATINDPNYDGSSSETLTIGKATASVVLGDLAQAYDGNAKTASATTTPEGLTIELTYDGSSTAPASVGTYAVAATINDANYEGSASGDLVIAKGTVSIVLGDLAQTYDGSPRLASVTTTPEGLTVNLTYDGSTEAPTGAGSYDVVATVDEANYAGSARDTLVIGKATVLVTLADLAATYDGTAKTASVTTDPPGLDVSLTYDGSSAAPTNAGSYAVAASVNDPNYEGSSTGTLVIYYAESSLAVVSPSAVNEGRLVTVPIRMSSAGEVGGLTFRIQYDPTYLKAPEFKWLGRSALGLADVVVDEAEGIIDATVSLNGSTYQSGVADVAEVKLRTRSVPLSSVLTPVEVTINDASDANGTTLDNVLGALNGAITINRRTFVGDVNGNGFLDISDATGILRLLSGAEPGVAPTQTRPWDTALNDVNQNGSLTSGDVTALLSLISRRGTPPSLVTPRTLRTLSVSGFETSSAPLPEFNPQPVGNAIRAMSAAATESARLSSRVYSAANGTVTVQLIVDNLTSPITGLSFQLNYPKDTLRLANVNAMQTGTLVPSSGVSRNWNLSTQAEFDAQTGEVRLAAASGTEWSNTSGIAATLVFNVLNDGGRDVFQTISVTDLAVSYLEQGGVELRNIAVSDAFYQRTIGEWATNNQVGSTTATDADKDGASDLAEYLAGTDPKSQVSRFSVREIRRPGGAVTRVQWATVKGVRYRVTTTTSLGSGWTLVPGSETDGTGAVPEIDISGSAGESKRFFRVEVAP